MTKEELLKEIEYVNATRDCRQKYANIVMSDLKLIRPLLEIVFLKDKVKSPRAAWIFEFVFKEKNTIIDDHLDFFCENLYHLNIDSATRPCAKVIEIIIENYYLKKDQHTIDLLTQKHKELIVEACFDWIIGDSKVAVKAYSMTSLYYLGTEFDWIHPELKQILEQGYQNGTAGYKARCRHILQLIKAFDC